MIYIKQINIQKRKRNIQSGMTLCDIFTCNFPTLYPLAQCSLAKAVPHPSSILSARKSRANQTSNIRNCPGVAWLVSMSPTQRWDSWGSRVQISGEQELWEAVVMACENHKDTTRTQIPMRTDYWWRSTVEQVRHQKKLG